MGFNQEAWAKMETKAAEIRRLKFEREGERLRKQGLRQSLLAGIQVTHGWSRKEMADVYAEQAKAKAEMISPVGIITTVFNSADHVLKQLFPNGGKIKPTDPLN